MSVQSLERALDILERVAADENGRSVGSVARELGLHKSTASRLVRALAERGYLQLDQATRRYRVGLQLVELAGAYLDNLELRVEAKPEMYQLSEQSGHTVFLAMLQESQVVYIDKTEHYGSLRRYAIIGTRAPAYSTALGKALLLERPEEEARAVLSEALEKDAGAVRTPNTHTSVESLLAELRHAREHGFTVDREENERGVRCVGAPIMDYRGRTMAAVSVSAPADQIPEERIEGLGALVRQAAERISGKIGYSASRTAPA